MSDRRGETERRLDPCLQTTSLDFMVRIQRETRKRTRVCPECKELFSPQGLNGHLRFKHKLEGEAVKEHAEAAMVTVTDGITERVDTTMGLIDRLNAIRGHIEGLPQQSLFGDRDETVDDCLVALKRREHECRNEIRKLAGKPLIEWVEPTKSLWDGGPVWSDDEKLEGDG